MGLPKFNVLVLMTAGQSGSNGLCDSLAGAALSCWHSTAELKRRCFVPVCAIAAVRERPCG